jgi:hypothetical protein
MKPSVHHLAVVLALVATFGCSRQDPKPAAVPPLAAAAPVAPAPAVPTPPREPGPYESPRPAGGREATPLPDLRAGEPREPTPKAGRQVLRCVVKGHYAYLDLNASCPEGPGERVTVFPTEGVEPPR